MTSSGEAKHVRLTKAQRAVLESCPDWSAPYEIVWRRHRATGEIISPSGNKGILSRLLRLELVEYGMPNNTYRITPSGLTALSSSNPGDAK